MKKKLLSLLLAFSMLLSMSVTAFAEPASVAGVTQATAQMTVPSTYKTVAENSNFVLYSEIETGKIAVKVKKSAYIWYSNPLDSAEENIAGGELKKRIDAQVVLHYTQGWSDVVTNSVTGSINRNGLSSKKIDNGIKFIYEFKDAGFTVPIQYILEEDGLKAQVLLQEITPDVVTRQQGISGSKDKIDVDFNITQIDFLQYFGAAGPKEDGYMFIPEGSGGIINFNNGKTNCVSYKAPIYGQYMDQSTMRNLSNSFVRMPVYGMKKGDNAFFSIINENESIGMINASISGRETSYNVVFPTIYRRVINLSGGQSRTQPLSESQTTHGNFSMKFYFLSNDKANYSEMAKIYQNYLVNEKGLKKTPEADKNHMYLELYSGVERKTSVFGIVRTILQPLTTYNDVKNISKSYIDSGIDNLVIKYNNWTKNSTRKQVPTSVSYERKLGGSGGFKKLLEYTESNNIKFYPSVNFAEYSESKSGFSSIFDAAKSPDQSPAYIRPTLIKQGELGFRWSLLKPNKLEEASNKFAQSYEKTGNKGIAINYIGEKLYSDNAKGGVKRGQTTDIWSDILKNYQAKIGSVLVENANAYAFPYVEHIINAPIPEFGSELIDENIPFYQMTLHGYISYSTPPVNLASDYEHTILKAIETGSCLNFTFVNENTGILMDSYLNFLYSCDYSTWFDKSVADYKKADTVLGQVAGKKMTGHSQIANGVYETIYEGGIKTIVNYNNEAVTTSYGVVNPVDFILVK